LPPTSGSCHEGLHGRLWRTRIIESPRAKT